MFTFAIFKTLDFRNKSLRYYFHIVISIDILAGFFFLSNLEIEPFFSSLLTQSSSFHFPYQVSPDQVLFSADPDTIRELFGVYFIPIFFLLCVCMEQIFKLNNIRLYFWLFEIYIFMIYI